MRIALALTAGLAVLGLAACKERPLPPPVKAPETATAANCVPAAPACPTTPAASPVKPVHRTGVGVGSHPVKVAPVRYAHRPAPRARDNAGYGYGDNPAPRTYARVYTDDRYGDTYYESGATAGYPRLAPPPPMPPRAYVERREVYVDGYGQEDRYGPRPVYRAPPRPAYREEYRREVRPAYPVAPPPYIATRPPLPPREAYRRDEYRQDNRQGGGYREVYRDERYHPAPPAPVYVERYPQRGAVYSYREERGYSEAYSQQGYGQGEAYGYHQGAGAPPRGDGSAYTTAGRNRSGFLTWAGKRD